MKLMVIVLLFMLTLISIIIKPYNKKEAYYTTIFAIFVFVLGYVNFQDTEMVIKNIWNAVCSLISIMIISAILEEIGFFKWAALTIVFTSEGSGKKLFLHTIILGALISLFFNNDGTVLILTPIVYEMVKELKFKKSKMIPFLFACGFIADTASVPLVVSNLANIVNSDTIGISFNYYISKMFLPGMIAIITVTFTLFAYFKNSIVDNFDTSKIQNPDDAVKDWFMFNAGIVVLVFVILGYFIGSKLKIPVSFISIAGAVTLLVLGEVKGAINSGATLKKAPWDVILFAFGMYIIVYGLYKNGFNVFMENILLSIKDKNVFTATILSGIISTVTACFMNNLPSVMVGAFSVKYGQIGPTIGQTVAFANILGNDIGAKLTPIGSLATIMWLNILRERGIEITWRRYINTAFFVISPVLLISLVVLGVLM